MFNNVIDSIRMERAKFARETEYIKETAADDIIDDRVEVAEQQYTRETMSELTEAADMLKNMPAEEDPVTEATELDCILNADNNITFDEMIGL